MNSGCVHCWHGFTNDVEALELKKKAPGFMVDKFCCFCGTTLTLEQSYEKVQGHGKYYTKPGGYAWFVRN